MRRAVFWDFGGVVLSSPFEAFNRYEQANGLPRDFIRSVNATNPDHNAWARLERATISSAEFDEAFAVESEALGHRVPGAEVLGLLAGDIRPQMVAALRRIREAGLLQACLTNNIAGSTGVPTEREAQLEQVMSIFHAVVESSKVGCRKPERRFYEIACELVDVTPDEVVFLDDLGVNLKPAAAMGMHTIKVVDPDIALEELEAVIGVSLR